MLVFQCLSAQLPFSEDHEDKHHHNSVQNIVHSPEVPYDCGACKEIVVFGRVMGRIWAFLQVLAWCLVYSGGAFAANTQNPFMETYRTYRVEPIKVIKATDGRLFKLERAWVHPKDERAGYTFERIQIRDSSGFIIAYTPTRMQAIPVCKDMEHCWVFMWKTVYPMPAIFKFNSDSKTWIREERPAMKYSRSGYPGEGFVEVVDPVFGLYGLVFYFMRNIWFFLVLSGFSFIFTLQIMKFHDLDPRKKDFVRLILSFLHFWIPPWLPLEPYLISAGIILFVDMIGTVYYGIASVLSVLVILTVFILTCFWVARARRKISEAALAAP